MKLIRKENDEYYLLINEEIKSLQEFNITKEDCDILTLGYSVETMAKQQTIIDEFNSEKVLC
jgi:phage regulator Rha-like protein